MVKTMGRGQQYKKHSARSLLVVLTTPSTGLFYLGSGFLPLTVIGDDVKHLVGNRAAPQYRLHEKRQRPKNLWKTRGPASEVSGDVVIAVPA
jgi:hypothetical protein